MADNNDPSLTPASGTDNSLQIAVLGHLLKAERNQTASAVETLASLLQAAIPDRVEVTLGGMFWSKNRPVESLTITFDNAVYHIAKSKHGSPVVKRRQVSAGIVLKNVEISMEVCITEVVAKLGELEKQSAATRIALTKFVTGR
jgi:hypothetical protein